MAAQPCVNYLDPRIVKSLMKISSLLTNTEGVNEREARTATLLSNLRGELGGIGCLYPPTLSPPLAWV